MRTRIVYIINNSLTLKYIENMETLDLCRMREVREPNGTFSFALVFSFLICSASAYRYIKMICFGVRGTIGYDCSVYNFHIIIFHFIWSYFWYFLYYYTLSKCSRCSQNKLLLWAAKLLERVGSAVAPINESDFEFKKADWSIICC